jgi:hypothetical protein
MKGDLGSDAEVCTCGDERINHMLTDPDDPSESGPCLVIDCYCDGFMLAEDEVPGFESGEVWWAQ